MTRAAACRLLAGRLPEREVGARAGQGLPTTHLRAFSGSLG